MMNAKLFVTMALLLPLCHPLPAQTGYPVEPGAGNWKTWVLSSGAQLRLPPPPDAATTAEELTYLKELRQSVDDTARRQIEYWNQSWPGYHWVQWLQNRIQSAGVNTPNATRQMALLNIAIYDATVAAWDSKYAHNRPLPSQSDPSIMPLVSPPAAPSYPNDFAVAAGAATAVLSYLYPADASSLQAWAEEAVRSRMFAGVSYPSDYVAGLELGKRAGGLVVDRARADNSTAAFTGTIPAGPEYWTGANPVCPMCGSWRTWAISSGSQFRPGPPPAYNSPEKQADLAAMKSIARPFAEQANAFYWQTASGIYLDWYNQVHLAILEDHIETNAPRSARAYALMSVAHYDAMVACWDGKYAYWAIRPVQLDPALTTLFATPNHPSYPAAHATTSMSIARMMAYLFPTRADTFLTQGNEAGRSRRVAGIHYQSDIDIGNAIGEKVAKVVIDWAIRDASN